MSGLHVAVHHFVEGAVPAAQTRRVCPSSAASPHQAQRAWPAGIGELNGDAVPPSAENFHDVEQHGLGFHFPGTGVENQKHIVHGWRLLSVSLIIVELFVC